MKTIDFGEVIGEVPKVIQSDFFNEAKELMESFDIEYKVYHNCIASEICLGYSFVFETEGESAHYIIKVLGDNDSRVVDAWEGYGIEFEKDLQDFEETWLQGRLGDKL